MGKITLGQKAIQNALTGNWSPSFKFHFLSPDEELTIKVNLVQASMISTNVFNALQCDPIMPGIDIPVDKDLSFNKIKTFFTIFDGNVEINGSNALDFFKIATLLKTEDVLVDIEKVLDESSEIKIENVLERIALKKNNCDYSKEIQFCASKLSQLIQKNSFEIFEESKRIEILLEILEKYKEEKSEEKVEHEIFHYFSSFPKKEFIQLASCLNFKILNNDDVALFLLELDESTFSNEAAKSLYEKFKTRKEIDLTSNRVKCDKNEGFDGIFNELRKRCNGNPETQGVVKIIAQESVEFPASNVLEYEGKLKSKYYQKAMKSKDETFITFDFGINKRVSICGYELKTSFKVNKYNYPKSWEIEGSNDLINWTTIHSVRYCETLNGPGKKCRAKMNNPTSNNFQYIRYKQLSNFGDSNEQKYMSLCAIELYGELIYK